MLLFFLTFAALLSLRCPIASSSIARDLPASRPSPSANADQVPRARPVGSETRNSNNETQAAGGARTCRIHERQHEQHHDGHADIHEDQEVVDEDRRGDRVDAVVILTLVGTAPSRLRKMALNATVWTAFASRSL